VPLIISVGVMGLLYPELAAEERLAVLPACVIIGLVSSAGYQQLSSSAGWLRVLPMDDQPRILIVGANERAERMLNSPDRFPGTGPAVIGCLDDDRERSNGTWPHLGAVDQLEEVLRREVIDEVWVQLPMRSHYEAVEGVIQTCRVFGVPARVESLPFEGGEGLSRDERGRTLGAVYQVTVTGSPLRLFTKRTIDVFGALCALTLSAPILLAAMLAVKLTSRGPALFAQERIGLRGREFTLYKLRTMLEGSDEKQGKLQHLNEIDGPVFKVRNDPRLTWIGRWLRRTSIDELPQLYNVLRGEMSLVGPRPARSKEVHRYESWQHHRLAVKPGLTCTWQVSGRSDLSFETWMALDLEYTRTWSNRGDIMLLFRTIPAVISMRGAW
jgi:exopolysaccharide biosynthesis polyprenyl glycosylphosphotransferase